MNRLYALFCCLFLIGLVEAQNPIDTALIFKAGLPVLEVCTVDNEEPTCDFVFPPEGAFGISITNATKVPGRAVLTNGNDTLFDSGDYVKDKSGMTIKIRGNTSAYYETKKPYKIKLQKKADMLARGNKRFNDKEWALIREGEYGINGMTGFKLNQLMGMAWTPSYMYVNLIMNGDYRGIYMLIENVKRNADCRIDVDKLTGYLFECDAYWWNEDVYFKTPLGKYFTFKYPDEDDITTEQVQYVSSAVEALEQAFIDGNYSNLIDVNSFASWLLIHDILGNYDSGGSNIFLAKYDNSDSSKIFMPTTWDFDGITDTPDNWARVHSDFFYYEQLFNSPDKSFVEAYKSKWEEMLPTIFKDMQQFLDDFQGSSVAKALQVSRVYEETRWENYERPTVNENIEQLKAWFADREAWLTQAIASIYTDTYINEVSKTRPSTTQTYDLSGRILQNYVPLKKGIYIRNGQKVVVK